VGLRIVDRRIGEFVKGRDGLYRGKVHVREWFKENEDLGRGDFE